MMRWNGRDGYRSLWVVIGILSILTGCGAVNRPIDPADTAVYFSPNGGGTEAVVRAIHYAQRRIWVQAYSFTSAPIAEALVAAHKRGVEVVAVLDKTNQSDKYSAATFLSNAGIKTLIDDRHAIAHNKVMLIDDRTLITGSFNFTKAAEERNAENLLILNDVPQLAGAYADNIVAHAHHSQPYQFGGEAQQEPVASQETSQQPTRKTTPQTVQASGTTTRTTKEATTSAARRQRTSSSVQVATAHTSTRISSVSGEVHANRRSKVYRTVGCRGYNLINPEQQVVFAEEQQAIAAGYRKSTACR